MDLLTFRVRVPLLNTKMPQQFPVLSSFPHHVSWALHKLNYFFLSPNKTKCKSLMDRHLVWDLGFCHSVFSCKRRAEPTGQEDDNVLGILGTLTFHFHCL